MLIHILFTILLFVALIVLIQRPLSRRFQIPQSLEVGIGAAGIFIFFYYIMAVVILPQMERADKENSVCGDKGLLMRCYSLSPDFCEDLWGQLEVKCHQDLASELAKLGPSALIGPRIKKCQNQKLDKMLKYSRKDPTDLPECQDLFRRLDEAAALAATQGNQ